jgi:hypothetical protein
MFNKVEIQCSFIDKSPYKFNKKIMTSMQRLYTTNHSYPTQQASSAADIIKSWNRNLPKEQGLMYCKASTNNKLSHDIVVDISQTDPSIEKRRQQVVEEIFSLKNQAIRINADRAIRLSAVMEANKQSIADLKGRVEVLQKSGFSQ